MNKLNFNLGEAINQKELDEAIGVDKKAENRVKPLSKEKIKRLFAANKLFDDLKKLLK
jgi:hypothetical protein